jgi:hypothetical protein
MTYVPGVARPPSCGCWCGATEGRECFVGCGGRSWVGLHAFRWATARPDPVAGSPEPGIRVRGRSTVAGPGGGAVPGGHRWRHRLSSRLPGRRPPRAQSPASTASDQSAPGTAHHTRRRTPMAAHQPPAREWYCCPTPRFEPTNTRPRQRRIRRATGMNQDGFPQQYLTHPIGDNAPQTWDRGPRHSPRPMLHLIPYPRSRRHGRAVL